MIARIKGTLVYSSPTFVILDTGGIAYKIHMPANRSNKLDINQVLTLWTHLVVRENEFELYGFPKKKECDFFELLIGVSGIGPKTALAIMGLASVSELSRAIGTGDTSYLTKVSGIGKKSAAKIILELKDRFEGEVGKEDITRLREEDDALEALRSLGYGVKEAREALKKVGRKHRDVSGVVREALRVLSG